MGKLFADDSHPARDGWTDVLVQLVGSANYCAIWIGWGLIELILENASSISTKWRKIWLIAAYERKECGSDCKIKCNQKQSKESQLCIGTTNSVQLRRPHSHPHSKRPNHCSTAARHTLLINRLITPDLFGGNKINSSSNPRNVIKYSDYCTPGCGHRMLILFQSRARSAPSQTVRVSPTTWSQNR